MDTHAQTNSNTNNTRAHACEFGEQAASVLRELAQSASARRQGGGGGGGGSCGTGGGGGGCVPFSFFTPHHHIGHPSRTPLSAPPSLCSSHSLSPSLFLSFPAPHMACFLPPINVFAHYMHTCQQEGVCVCEGVCVRVCMCMFIRVI